MLRLPNIHKLPLSLRTTLLSLAPKIAKPVAQLLPYGLQKYLLLTALNSIFKQQLADGDFRFLQDNWLKITILDLNLSWWLSVDGKELRMAEASSQAIAQVSFSANSEDLLLIAGRKQDPDTLFFQRRLKIEGDTELGLALKNLIDSVDPEELPGKVHLVIDLLANFVNVTRQQAVPT